MKLSRLIASFVFATFIFTALFGLGLSARTSAAPCPTQADILGIPTWYKYLDSEDVQGKCRPIINVAQDALPIGFAVIEAGLTIAGLVAVTMVFFGAFKYVLTQGEPDKAKSARSTVINAAIGLVITILATRIVSFIAGRLG